VGWPWSNFSLISSIYQCTYCGVNLGKCRCGPGLIFCSAVVYEQCTYDGMNLEGCRRGPGLIVCSAALYYLYALCGKFYYNLFFVGVISWSDCDDSEDESTTFSQLWTLSIVFGN